MSYSKVTICNKALGLLSATSILTFDEDTTEGELCRSQYDVVLRTVLEEHSWSFAIKRRKLSAQLEVPLFGYSKKFSKPADCLRILKVTDGNDDYIEWAIESGDILCDADAVNLIYIFNNETADTYTSTFIDAVSTRLAAELSHVLTESTNLYNALIQQYNAKILNAVNNDSLQGTNADTGRADFIRIR